MKPKQLAAEQSRIVVSAIQLYQSFLELREERRAYRGGLHWKKVGSREYLVKTLDRAGHQQSLGPRSAQSEEIWRTFTERKGDLAERLRSHQEELRRQARFCVAAGVNRVPRISADIVRLLESSGLLGTHLIIIGSHALYAYEMAAGVQLKGGLLQTEGLDTLLDSRKELEIAGAIRIVGLLGILQKVDKTFRLARQRSFRAVNAKGFMVDLIRAPVDSARGGNGLVSLGGGTDLVAEQLHGLQWIAAAPFMTQIVIAENGFPVRFVVPDPRVFALHKLWVSLQPTRDPVKRKRDFRQAEATAQLALHYLNLRFDDPVLKALPAELTSMVPGLLERLRARGIDDASRLPVGFEDFEESGDAGTNDE